MMKTRDILGRNQGREVWLGEQKKRGGGMRPSFVLILHRALKIPSEFP